VRDGFFRSFLAVVSGLIDRVLTSH
jgi:hypothetical protein